MFKNKFVQDMGELVFILSCCTEHLWVIKQIVRYGNKVVINDNDNRVKILTDILKVLVYVFKSSFDLENLNWDINSTFSDSQLCSYLI